MEVEEDSNSIPTEPMLTVCRSPPTRVTRRNRDNEVPVATEVDTVLVTVVDIEEMIEIKARKRTIQLSILHQR